MWWMPSCMIGPPGLRARCARQAPGLKLPGSDMFASASTTSPSAPVSISSRVRRAAPSRRKACPTMSATPPSAQASRIRSPASSVSAIGFSTNTWRPRAAHASVCSSCVSLGVASTTPSTAGCPTASSNESAARQPKRSANAARFSSLRLWQVTISSPARCAAAASRGAHMPVPTIAMPVIRAARASSRPPAGASCRARSRSRGCRPRAARRSRRAPRARRARSAPRGSAGRACP